MTLPYFFIFARQNSVEKGIAMTSLSVNKSAIIIEEQFLVSRIAELNHKKGHANFAGKNVIVPFGAIEISEESLPPPQHGAGLQVNNSPRCTMWSAH